MTTRPKFPGMSPHDLLAAELARRARELPIEDLARLVMSQAAPARRRRVRSPGSGAFEVRPIEQRPASVPPGALIPSAPAPVTLRDLVTQVIAAHALNPLTSAEIVRAVLAMPGHTYREPSIRSEISRQVSEGQAVRVGPKIGGVYRQARRAG